MAAAPLLDREFLERLERLTIHWHKSFAGLVGGHNKSHLPGAGQEFLDHRNFHSGDDLRAVNWAAYMRLDKMFLKMFQVEPRVPVRMLVDVSASMTAHGAGKFDYARKLAAALCYVGLVRLDSIDVHGFSNHLGHRIASSGGRHRFHGVMQRLAALEPEGPTDYMAVTREFIGSYKQRGLVIILSDFLDDGGCERALQYLADYGHELMLLQLWAEEDRTPPWSGELEVQDAETGVALKLDFDDEARRRYTHSFDEYAAAVQSMAHRSMGRYAGVSVAQSLDSIIFTEMVRMQGIA